MCCRRRHPDWHRPDRGRRRDHRLRRHDRPASRDIARTAWLAAGLPEAVPGVTVRPAVRLLPTGRAFRCPGGPERHRRPRGRGRGKNMSQVPIAAAMIAGQAFRPRRSVRRIAAGRVRRSGNLAVPGRGHDRCKWGIDRADMEEYALVSHQRAIAAIDRGDLATGDRAVRGFAEPMSARAATPPWSAWRSCSRCAPRTRAV